MLQKQSSLAVLSRADTLIERTWNISATGIEQQQTNKLK